MSVENAKIFLESIKQSTVYLMIGGQREWNSQDSLNPEIVNEPNADSKDYNDSIFLKKTIPSQYSLAARKIDWEEGIVFDQYDGDDFNLSKKNFYCINEDGNVYKCISNGNGAPSTEMPSAVTPNRFQTLDGYIWKFIASIPEPISLLFNNSTWAPISDVTEPAPGFENQYVSQQTAIPGTVDRLDIVQGGKKYSDQTYIIILGDGQGAKAEPVIHSITGEITGVTVTETGYGYSYASVSIVDPSHIGGSEAILKAIISPVEGHGKNPVQELYASTVVGSIEVMGNEEGYIDGSFDFRKVSLLKDIETAEIQPVQISPKPNFMYVNNTEDITFIIKENVDGADHVEVKASIFDASFVIFADPSNPYGEEEQWFTDNGVSVWYQNGTWKITFESSSEIYSDKEFSMAIEIFDENNDSIFGNIAAPTTANTFEYLFEFDSTIPNFTPEINNSVVVDDPRYNMTISLSLEDVSGDFERGEEIKFLNGGVATIVNIDGQTIQVSSPQNLMTGPIIGQRSGASANCVSYTNRPFPISGSTIYRHYFDKRTKIDDQNLRVTPIFKF